MAKAKRKKNSALIVLNKKVKLPRVQPNKYPRCYGEKDQYCREDLCGEWFDSCKSEHA